ncbi:Peptidoglycan/LPS O-acetylase OafA/YrhL, contains acyltransferase and SGNH-hydrolase domains [Acinetobacter marinus]|uniref:Peptidoglycan/LPS O-acetylase OafA/YrhL, contains acyltransferase and SGNH-hydrolase domains n=1 Tax=Acinetobacter marinus TaxID=281375 RepID=A0A1G6MMI3_9GAMM|nr:acyltransferase [Acinetobacter marinus]SDC56722.1 Peptidoglycan/LPS O-acetylase OafA/YrhL, contains acyltransferase and SGNH-hydrolase domains [Acinetobacter marinus]
MLENIHSLNIKSASDLPLDKTFSLQLESLRGLSAIVVLFSHAFQAFIAPQDVTFYSIVRLLGQSAVMMFFILSGFLIGHSIQKNLLQNHTFSIRKYARQRFRRILPPFIFALCWMLLLYLLAPYCFATGSHDFELIPALMIRTAYDFSWVELLGSVFFVNEFLTPTLYANAPLWSLSYEVWFYVLAGLMAMWRYAFARAALVIVLIILSLLNLQFLVYFGVWLLAFAFSFDQVRRRLDVHALKIIQWIFGIFALCIAMYDAYQFFIIDQVKTYQANLFTLFNPCVGIVFAIFLLQLYQKQRTFTPFWVSSARFSYTLYVTHFPILLFIMGVFPQSYMHSIGLSIFSLTISMSICIAFAWLMAKFLEPQIKAIT